MRQVRLKRETGENPVRSRRCDGENFHINPLESSGKGWKYYEPESEELPVLYAVTLRTIGGKKLKIDYILIAF